MTRAEKVISALGYAGLTPFVAACGLLYAGEEARLFCRSWAERTGADFSRLERHSSWGQGYSHW